MGRRCRQVVIALAFLLGGAGPVSADAGNHTPVPFPADGMVLPSSPRQIRVPVRDGLELELHTIDGRQVAFTGPVRFDQGLATASPPYLSPGTYLLGWSDPDAGGRFQGAVSFSVGAPSAVVDITGSTSGSGPALSALALMFVFGAASSALTPLGTRRRAGALLACGVVVSGAVAVLTGAPVPSVLFALGVVAALTPARMVSALLIAGAAVVTIAPDGPLGPVADAAILGAGLAAWLGAVAVLARLARGPEPVLVPAPSPVHGRKEESRADGHDAPDLSALGDQGPWWLSALVASTLSALVPVWVLFLSGAGFGVFYLPAAFGLVLLGAFALPALVVALARSMTGRDARPLLAKSALLVASVGLLSVSGFRTSSESRIEALVTQPDPPAACLDAANRLKSHQCLERTYTALVARDGVTRALENLEQLIVDEPQARLFCHDASHAIGRAAMAATGSVSEAFASGFDVCDFGFYHGIVEGAAVGLDDEAFRAAVPTLCTELEPLGRLYVNQCTHGLGHAAARRTNNDMIRALGFCEALDAMPGLAPAELDWVLNGCGTGVTMEWFSVATSAGLDAVEPPVAQVREVCALVPDRWLPECLEYVGNTLDTSKPVDSLRELASWCATTRDRSSCMIGLARAAGGVGVAPQDAFAICELGGPARDGCVRFYIAGVATTVEYRVEAVDELCAQLPEADRAGPESLCARVRQAVAEILAAGGRR